MEATHGKTDSERRIVGDHRTVNPKEETKVTVSGTKTHKEAQLV